MADLTSKRRNALPSGSFGLPSERKYPMPDKSHAANAKARASQQEKAGNISEDEKSQIDAKADRKLGKKKGKMPSPGAGKPAWKKIAESMEK